MQMTTLMKSAVLLLMSLAACSEGTGPEQRAESTTVVAEASVIDEEGQPLQRVWVVATAWSVPGVPPDVLYAQTDEAGVVRLAVITTMAERLDSLQFWAGGDECSGFMNAIHRQRAVAVDRRAEADTVRTTMILPSEERPLLATGTICILGYVFDDSPFWLELEFESITPTIAGRWGIRYQMSKGDAFGTFTGTRTEDELRLTLDAADPSAPCPANYAVYIPLVNVNGFGAPRYEATGCEPAYEPGLWSIAGGDHHRFQNE